MTIFPYGPMVNGKAYSAEDIRRLNIATCDSCGAKSRLGKVCERCMSEVLVEVELNKEGYTGEQ